MSFVFAILFFVSFYYCLKNISTPAAPFYVFSTATTLAAWFSICTHPSIGKVSVIVIIAFSSLIVYFMMRTKPYEKS